MKTIRVDKAFFGTNGTNFHWKKVLVQIAKAKSIFQRTIKTGRKKWPYIALEKLRIIVSKTFCKV